MILTSWLADRIIPHSNGLKNAEPANCSAARISATVNALENPIETHNMPRPRHSRRVGCLPQSNYYKPRGIPLAILEQVNLSFDELEAIRLADLEGMYHEQAAEKMNISRQTFGRIIESAHRKIADALVNGKALAIEGGTVEFTAPGTMPPSEPSALGPTLPHSGPATHRGRGRHRGRPW
jgi:predicted DNA-binding protein (UPF0251 family)